MPDHPSNYWPKLTGNIRYRAGWRGRVILQVEVRQVAYYVGKLAPTIQREAVFERVWRDARMEDLDPYPQYVQGQSFTPRTVDHDPDKTSKPPPPTR